jgi:low temperature requirement protein LtrA
VGLATFISGAILRFSPLIIGAVVFWIASGISPLFSGVDFLLVYAAVIFLGYVIPGLMLAKKSQADV